MADDNELNPLLRRQLRRAGINVETPPTAEQWRELVGLVSRTYTNTDNDRYLLERSLDKSSAEMQILNEKLAEDRDRLRRELEVATVLQTSILPGANAHTLFDVAATMLPATEVGGDYYDVVSTTDACWLGIGDVAGHGLRTAMIMMMLQSIVGAMVRTSPAPAPSAILEAVNRALWDNIRERLHANEHVTCTLLACDGTGEVRFAGAHEDILVCRAAGGPCARVETRGTWLAAIPDVAGRNVEQSLRLAPGDVMVLFTDGITEARNAERAQFGLDRLADVIEQNRERSVADIRDAIVGAVQAWMARQDDDLTVVVSRYRA